jgi:Cys-tRNA(Pro)/Cys-tRNA(Cys) deacylase
MSKQKTLAMKLLEGKNVSYEALAYPTSLRDAEEVASALGLLPEQVFKTLVVARPRSAKPMLVMIPSNRQLDLKKLATAVKEKKLKMATYQEAEHLTGLQVGGISALALMNRGFSIFLDKSAEALEQITISAGQRGWQVTLAVADLVAVTQARFVDAVTT